MKQDSNVNFQHQETNTECGMYCLYFIISLIQNKHPVSYFKNHRISDDRVEKLREEYFNLLRE